MLAAVLLLRVQSNHLLLHGGKAGHRALPVSPQVAKDARVAEHIPGMRRAARGGGSNYLKLKLSCDTSKLDSLQPLHSKIRIVIMTTDVCYGVGDEHITYIDTAR